ncbi:MAG: methyltransferase domain-containing protein, partial [Polyangiaceae bacterium]|nr:methyltransferase domain-containing protein [Polyangiaceae bacterium]
VERFGPSPRVLIVGAGLAPVIEGAPLGADQYACDLDARAVEACRERYPWRASRISLCPGPYELPAEPRDVDLVVAKEVIEHVDDPARFAAVLASRVRVGGELALTTPNYGAPWLLPLLERTALEWVARRDGFSRRDIHPSKFDEERLARLDAGPGMRLVEHVRTRTSWALFARFRRVAPCSPSR